MTLPEMREDKGRLAKQANDILEAARADGRHDLKKDEEEKFDAIHADIDKLSASIAREERQAATMASLESGGRRSEPNTIEQRGTSGGRTSDGKITEYDREEAFRAWALAGSDCELTERQQKNAQRCGVNLASKKMKLNLFAPVALKASNLKNPTEDDIRAWHRQMDEKRAGLRQDETRAALTGAQSTTTTGGYTVADAAMRALEVALLQFGGVRSVATIIRTDTGGPLPMPTTNDTANKGARLAENTTATELEMTFSQVVLDAFKYSSKYLLASVEFLQDSSINVSEFIGNALGNRIGRIQNDEFTTGTGSGQPNGIVNAAASGVTGVADPPTHDNLQDLIHSVDPAYRPNGKFMMHDSTLKSLKKIKVLQYSGDVVGLPLWQPGLTLGAPDTLLGFPYVINQSMAVPGSTAKKIIFGDFSKFIIRDCRDVTLLRLDERFAELHQVAFLAFARSDSDLLDAGTNPVKYMAQT